MKQTGDQLRFDFETVKTAINRWRADHAPFLTRDEAVRHILGEWLDREGYMAQAADVRAPQLDRQPGDDGPGPRLGHAPQPASVGVPQGSGSATQGPGRPIPRAAPPVEAATRLEGGAFASAHDMAAVARQEVGPRPARHALPPGAARLAGPAKARRDWRPGHPSSVSHLPRPLGEGGRPASHAPAP